METQTIHRVPLSKVSYPEKNLRYFREMRKAMNNVELQQKLHKGRENAILLGAEEALEENPCMDHNAAKTYVEMNLLVDNIRTERISQKLEGTEDQFANVNLPQDLGE